MPYERFAGVNKTVKFNGRDSYTDFGLILVDYEIGIPQRKIVKVSNNLTQGDIDISDAVAKGKFNNRKLTFNFRCLEGERQYDSIYRKVLYYLNGEYMENSIAFDGRYYTGRVSVNKWKSSKHQCTVTIEVDAKPYSYDVTGTKRFE